MGSSERTIFATIDVQDERQVALWTRTLAVTAAELRKAVEQVGKNIEDVIGYLALGALRERRPPKRADRPRQVKNT
jgi:hypothetical protein